MWGSEISLVNIFSSGGIDEETLLSLTLLLYHYQQLNQEDKYNKV